MSSMSVRSSTSMASVTASQQKPGLMASIKRAVCSKFQKMPPNKSSENETEVAKSRVACTKIVLREMGKMVDRRIPLAGSTLVLSRDSNGMLWLDKQTGKDKPNIPADPLAFMDDDFEAVEIFRTKLPSANPKN